MSKDIEIEIKLPLRNPTQVSEFLAENAEQIGKDLYQKDTYFIPKHRDFLKTKYPFEWLRLRETDKGASLNYKHWYPENVMETDYCDEFETKLDHPDAVRKIFEALDFQQAVVVEKHRSTWEFQETEIAIDNVKQLGVFIELEAKKHFQDPRKGKAYLFKVLEQLGAEVGDPDLRGYPFRMLEKQGYMFTK